MSIASTDIIFYGTASQAEDDSSTQGGDIDTTTIVVFDSSSLANSLSDTVKVVSSNAGDTSQTVTVTGRAASGSIVSEVLSLNGTTLVAGATTFLRLMKIVINASHTGTVTVTRATGGTVIATMVTGVLKIKRLFYNVSADASGGSSRDFYEKIFVKNTHASLSLLGAQIQENADPLSDITFDLESSVDGTNSTASRLNTAPSSMLGSFDSANKNVPGTDLASGSKIGVWLKLTLPAGTSPQVSTYTIRATGSTI